MLTSSTEELGTTWPCILYGHNNNLYSAKDRSQNPNGSHYHNQFSNNLTGRTLACWQLSTQSDSVLSSR